MQTDLALVLLVLVVAFALVAGGLCWAAIRWANRTRRMVRRQTERLDQGRPAAAQRLADAKARASRMAIESNALGERLDRADAAIAAMSEQLRERRGSVDEAIRERLIPLARWFSRVVAIARLWRMQREMWRG